MDSQKNNNLESKSVFVGVVGLANVGKSSLINKLVGQKVSIVSNKPQTTRNKITGILTKDEVQFVFFDLPGFHKKKNKLSEYMIKQINQGVSDIDVCVLVVDATNKFIKDIEIDLINQIKNLSTNIILVINKIDLLKNKSEIIKVIERYSEKIDFKSVIPMSVKKNDGVNILLDELYKFAVLSPHFFSQEMFTDQIERVIISEIIREKIMQYFGEEIPYGVAVVIEKFKSRNNTKNIIDIEAVIYCERYSHKGIIIGQKGEALKRVASKSRIEIEELLESKVNLKCWVKVKNNWRNDEKSIKNFGYNIE
ncbi:MAG: GTPase Era [Oscillospiraceae bacterium]|nr:GTPase Era [Oscillospiraceae bacterium]